VKVRLKQSEIETAERMARLLYRMSRAAGLETNKMDKSRSQRAVDVLGIQAEIVVRNALGLGGSYYEIGADHGADLFVDCKDKELRIQVKGTFATKGNLLLPLYDEFKWDAAILVTKTDQDDVFDIPGYISSKGAQSIMVKKDLGHGEGYFIAREELRPIGLLMQSIQEMKLR